MLEEYKCIKQTKYQPNINETWLNGRKGIWLFLF